MNVLSRFRSYGILAAAAIVFAVSVLFSVERMLSEQTAPEQTNTESVVWAASRIEIELYLFLDAIGTFAEDDSSMTREDLRGRFVALRDQFASLRGGSAAEALRTSPNFAAIAETVADGIDRIDVALASLRKDDKPAITRLKEQAMRLAQPMHTLSVQALQLDTSASEFRYKRVQRVYIELVGFFIGILVSGGVLVFLLFRGVRRAQRLLDERQIADERLRDSEQRFRDFAASASDWLWDTDARLRFTHFSQGYLERIGLASAATLGKTFDEIAHLDGDEAHWADFQGLLARRQPFREIRFQLRDGSGTTRTIRMNGVPVFDSTGEFTGYRGTGTDITDQIEAEREADRVRTLLSEAVESLEEGFIICDPGDRIVLINNNFRKLYPKSGDAMRVGALFEDIVRDVIRRGEVVVPHGHEETWIRDRLDQHRNPRGPVEQRLADGRWVQVNEQRLANGWHIGTRVDITQLKQREEALRREALIWEQISEGVIITDLHGTITNWNPAAESVFGYTAAEMLGRSPDLFYSPQQTAGLTTSILKSVRRDGRWAGQIHFTRKDHRSGIAETVVVPLRTDDGHLVAAIWVNEDVTERKRYEETLRGAKEQAEAASVAKSRFLATMSHEIRTPMNGVLGMLDLLLHTELSDEQRRYTETARESGEGLLVVIDDILDFSKMEAGKLTIETTDFDLRELVEAVLDLLMRHAQAKGIEISALIEPSVPTRLRGDSGRIRQVILNLTGNAVKFTEKGGVAVTVTKGRETDTHVEIRFEIQDTGIGIAADRKNEMFSEFTQADPSTTRRFGGTGLGLAISKKLVELMNGTIGFTSEVGQGSTFWFTVTFERQAGAVAAPDMWDSRIGTRRVLIGDSNMLSGRILQRRLALRGQHVETAGDRAGAAAALKDAATAGRPYDVVVIDKLLIAPDLRAFCDEIRSHPAIYGAPKLILTSRIADGDTTEKIRPLGFDDHLQKPIRQRTLLEALRRILDIPPDNVPIVAVAPRRHEETLLTASRRARLLLAEDSAVNQVVAIAMLSKFGYEIDAVETGIQAVDAVQTKPYDLILMDVSMPEMDGLDATRAIRALPGAIAHIPIIAMTAHAMESDRDKCMAAGMNDYIAKPVNRVKLLETVARWLPTQAAEPQTAPAEGRPTPQFADSSRPGAHAGSVFPSDFARIPVLDASTLSQLESDTSAEVLSELISTYVAETGERVIRMGTAATAGDLQSLGREAHALKSSSGTFGAARLQAVARAIEMACREGRASEASRLLHDIEALSGEAIAALSNRSSPARATETAGMRP
ncbi:MAG: PAS domain S-box protein [Alphaproteobacteria bacterium]|mgnify:CR=1 FL=1